MGKGKEEEEEEGKGMGGNGCWDVGCDIPFEAIGSLTL